MKKYCLTYMAAIAALSASAAAPQAERKTDSLHIASLSPREAATIDSIVAMRLRLQPKQIESIFATNDEVAIDTLESGNDAIQVELNSNNTWKYVRNREIAKDSTIFEKYWDTTTLFPYKEVDMSSMPKSVVIDLVDSVTSYHCPYQGSVHPRGKYGPRRRRQHQGVDLPLKAGDPVYATFCGRVRISEYNKGGYGNLVIIRHDNGLETYWLDGAQHGAAPAFRDPLLRAVVRPRAAHRLQERTAVPRDLPAEKIVLQHLFERRAGLRRRDRQRRAGQEGGGRKGSHEVPPHQVGRHAGRHRPQVRYDRDKHLPTERHQVGHAAAHRPLAAGAVGSEVPMGYGTAAPTHRRKRPGLWGPGFFTRP